MPTALAPDATQPAPAADPHEALQQIRSRLIRPLPNDRLLGWLLPLAVTVLGGVLRFWRLSRPGGHLLVSTKSGNPNIVFDETYYAHDSWSLLHHGVETATSPTLNGVGCLKDTHPCAAFVVHPPLGKWVMAVGEEIFGRGHTIVSNNTIYPADPIAFRFMGALVGTIAILMVGRLARRMFRSTALGVIAATIFASKRRSQ